MSDLASLVVDLGQHVWQQQREEPTLCFVAIAPFLLGAGIIGLRSLLRAARSGGLTGGEQS